MELYRETKIRDSGTRSLRELQPESVGRILRPLDGNEDLLDEMVQI